MKAAKDRSGMGLTEHIEFFRHDLSRRLSPERKARLGQFFTPAPVGCFMASLLSAPASHLRLLEPGAGIGSLIAACVENLCGRTESPERITVVAYEIDELLTRYLVQTLELCARWCGGAGIDFDYEVRDFDFLGSAENESRNDLFSDGRELGFNCVLMNPPYGKIRSDSEQRAVLRRIGIETSNLYTGFLAAAIRLLHEGGELIAITPRSFCNGPYFRPFRQFFLSRMSLRRVHIFESRSSAFSDDEVLQENIIFRAVRDTRTAPITISSSAGPGDPDIKIRRIEPHQLVWPRDPQAFLHIVPDEAGQRVADAMARLEGGLEELGLEASTGRVVAFRAKSHLRDAETPGSVPLVHPHHLEDAKVAWPGKGRKPEAIVESEQTAKLLVPNANYVLLKRFTAKEESRRIVAAVFDAACFDTGAVGFENHLNYIHSRGAGLDLTLARGLAAFLNSTLLDSFFRQFSGHTQVNATDLRTLPLPSRRVLEDLGSRLAAGRRNQEELDQLVEEVVLNGEDDPGKLGRRISEAREVLEVLDVPEAQQNERSALALLAMLDLRPDTPWIRASNPLMWIHDMLGFFDDHYGVTYAENTRETVRRQTVHQFMDAGIVLKNPDDLARPTNSPHTVYQVSPDALALLRTFRSEGWEHALRDYKQSVGTLRTRYARRRKLKAVPVHLASGKVLKLSPGPHNELIQAVVEEFAPRFAPGGRLLYVGDTARKFAHLDEDAFGVLNISIASAGKMPDVVVHHTKEDWLVLVEAVTSHGPVSPTRRNQLEHLFESSTAGLVFVTAFPDRRTMVSHLGEISWETEVWVASAPDHLIHFDGERFLGPY